MIKVHQETDYEKNACRGILLVLMPLFSKIHLDHLQGDGQHPSSVSISITFILADQILKGFDNPDYQNLDQLTRALLLEPVDEFSTTNIIDLIVTNERCIDTIENGIDIATSYYKSLTEWVLGYELTEEGINTAKVEIYWLIKDIATKVDGQHQRARRCGLEFLDMTKYKGDDGYVYRRKPTARMCFKCMDGLPHEPKNKTVCLQLLPMLE